MMTDDELEGIETWTPVDVAKRYRYISTRMMECVEKRRAIAEELPQLKSDLEHKVATTRITEKAKGEKLTVSDLDAIVTVETRQESLAYELCKERKSAINAELNALEEILGMLRSVGKDARYMGGHNG